jgi:hypothetical protein
MKRPVWWFVFFLFLASWCSAEELKKLQAPVKGSLEINPVTKQSAPVQSSVPQTITPAQHTAVQVPTITGPTYQKNVADIFKSAGSFNPGGLGDRGPMDPGLKRAYDRPLVDDETWVTKTAEAKLTGSDSKLPGLGAGSIDQSEIVIESDAPAIPDEDTIPMGSPKFSASAPIVTPDNTITPAGGIVARAPAGSDTPTAGGGFGPRKREAAQRLLVDAATIGPRTLVVPEDSSAGEEPSDTGGTGFGPRKRAAAQRLLVDAATTEPRVIHTEEEDDTIPLGSPTFAASAPAQKAEESLTVHSVVAQPYSEEGGSADAGGQSDSLEERILSQLGKLQENKEEALESKHETKSDESKSGESS